MKFSVPFSSFAWIVVLLTVWLPWAPCHAQTSFATGQFVGTTLLPTQVKCADIDGDGLLDVVTSSPDAADIEWFQNQGDGTFVEMTTLNNPTFSVLDFVAKDLDLDGDVDLAASNGYFGDGFVWYENDGTGVFEGPFIMGEYDVLPTTYYLDCADIDGDGDVDCVGSLFSQIVWLENTGFDFVNSYIDEFSVEPLRIELVDIDGDLDMDFFACTSHLIRFYENDGAGNYTRTTFYYEQGAEGPNARTRPADLDLDGDLDVLFLSGSGLEILYFSHDGIGSFSEPIPLVESSSVMIDLRCRDLDGDQDVDLIFGNETEGTIEWMENLGDLTFSEPQTIGIQDGPRGLAIADLDQDNALDVVALGLSDEFATGSSVWYENQIALGCTDESALNFSSEAQVDDGSCCFHPGCDIPHAINYDPLACGDGSCEFLLFGNVFHDRDGSQALDENEDVLPFRTVKIPALGITLSTDDAGNYETTIPEGVFEIVSEVDENFPFTSTANPISVNTQEPFGARNFGMFRDGNEFSVDLFLYPASATSLCNDEQMINLCFRNTSNVTLSGTLIFEYDSIFQGHELITPAASDAEHVLTYSYEGLVPGQMRTYNVTLFTPGVEHIGETFEHSLSISGFYLNQEVAIAEVTREREVACAYDPNDKQAFPEGFTDDHRILNDSEIEYLVRFQNTGNAPAQTVLIRDTLDASLDFSSFELLANSHSVVSTLDENTGEVVFLFSEIMLPDSTCCEPESHGLVSYSVRPLPDLTPETRIENTAYIFFDNNEPIVTNTTWHTIHTCAENVEIESNLVPGCPGEDRLFAPNYDFSIDWPLTFDWQFEGVEIGSDTTLILSANTLLDGPISLTVSNPLCQEGGWITYEPGSAFNWATCHGDLNCDDEVDALDLVQFLGEYACTGPHCTFDLNASGAVDCDDLLVVLGAFGNLCEP